MKNLGNAWILNPGELGMNIALSAHLDTWRYWEIRGQDVSSLIYFKQLIMRMGYTIFLYLSVGSTILAPKLLAQQVLAPNISIVQMSSEVDPTVDRCWSKEWERELSLWKWANPNKGYFWPLLNREGSTRCQKIVDLLQNYYSTTFRL